MSSLASLPAFNWTRTINGHTGTATVDGDRFDARAWFDLAFRTWRCRVSCNGLDLEVKDLPSETAAMAHAWSVVVAELERRTHG